MIFYLTMIFYCAKGVVTNYKSKIFLESYLTMIFYLTKIFYCAKGVVTNYKSKIFLESYLVQLNFN